MRTSLYTTTAVPSTKSTAKKAKAPHNGHGRQAPGGDPLAYVKADELRNLVIDLDEAHSDLMGRALNGDNGAYALAQVVKTAADLLFELRGSGI
jgi:hypothetical protein